MKTIFKIAIFSFIAIISATLLVIFIKGQADPLHFQVNHDTSVGGPFEGSNSNSRYALVEAIVENHTFIFTDEQARFAAPDLVLYEGKYFSIFTPGISFIAVPFYILGKSVGYAQLGAYSINLLFAVLNILLITIIGRKLKASFFGSVLSGFLFVFGTNALSYSQTLTQHNVSTFLILLSLILAVSNRNFINNLLLGITFSAGLLVDIPNGVIMAPSIIYVFFSQFERKELKEKITIIVKLNGMVFLLGLIPLLFVFAIYNYSLTGSYTKLGQTIGRVDYVPQEVQLKGKTSSSSRIQLPYNTRAQIRGLSILLLSSERGWFYYSPVIIIGILGLILAIRNKKTQKPAILFTSVAAMVVISYSMFGDPWGGWSFGPRYLIPASAVVMTGIGVAITRFKKNILFIILFSICVIYSVSVSTLGAITTNNIPPKIEAVALSVPIPYTYEYNLSFLEKGEINSLLYNIYLSGKLSSYEFWYYCVGVIVLITILLYAGVFVETRNKK